MSDEVRRSSAQVQQLDRLIAAYLEAEATGKALDRRQLLAEHPHLAAELAAFFASHDAMKQLAPPPQANDGALFPEANNEQDETLLARPQPRHVTLPGGAAIVPLLGTKVHYFGDYELLEEIGRGGMGVVYKARQISLNRIVALKMILAGQLASEEDVKRFHTEAEAAAQLDHPGIVPIYEVGQHEGQHYFSMGYVEGQSLAARVAQGPLPPREAAEIVKAVAEAVHYAHQKGVIHRDLKPANILLGRAEGRGQGAEGRGQSAEPVLPTAYCPLPTAFPRITDFGLAKRVTGESGLTATGQVMGTPSYMPPEQAAGKIDQIGPASDVYALGAILYCFLTGRPPFQSPSSLDTLLQVIEQEPVPPRQLDARIPRDLETIALKCLEKDRQRRYPTAQILANELGRYLAGEPIRARPVSRPERLWRWCKRKPVVAGLIAGVAASLLLGAIVSTYFAVNEAVQRRRAEQREKDAVDARDAEGDARRDAEAARTKETEQRRRAETEAERARRHLYIAHMNLAQGAWENARVAEVLDLLDRHRPQPGQEDLRGFEWYYLSGLCHSELLTLKGSARCVAFSPDGKRIATGGDERAKRLDTAPGRVFYGQTVKVWDAATGQQTLTLDGHLSRVEQVVFIEPQKGNDVPHRFPSLPTPTKTGANRPTCASVYDISFLRVNSPDGRRLASASQDGTVKVWDASTGQEVLTLKGHADAVWGVAFSPDGKRLASASWDKTVKLWDATSGQETFTFKGHPTGLLAVAFSPDGRRLASGGFDGAVKVWDAATGQEMLTLKGHAGWVWCVVFSRDGKRLASASRDGTVKVWDAATAQEVFTLSGHTRSVASVAFSPDGKRLASGSETVKVWDAATGRETLTLRGGGNRVAFSPDGASGWRRAVKMGP